MAPLFPFIFLCAFDPARPTDDHSSRRPVNRFLSCGLVRPSFSFLFSSTQTAPQPASFHPRRRSLRLVAFARCRFGNLASAPLSLSLSLFLELTRRATFYVTSATIRHWTVARIDSQNKNGMCDVATCATEATEQKGSCPAIALSTEVLHPRTLLAADRRLF